MPKTYSAAERESMCKRVIAGLSRGTPLTVLCAPDDMPGVRTVYDWVDVDPELAADIARARDEGFDRIAQDVLDILDAAPERVITTTGEDRTESRIDSAAVQWAKNRAEGRLKLLAKWDPKRYGDMIKHAAPDGESPAVTALAVAFVRPGEQSKAE